MRTAELIENSAAFKTLKRDADCGALSHAYLLVSADALALDELTDRFLSYAVSKENAKPNVGGAVSEHNYPDIIYLPESGDKMSVKDVNLLTDTAFVTPLEAKVKYYVISYGETMNEPSQNKLLKTLEEPPPCCRIVIKTAATAKLLPTVLSRCRKVEIEPFSEDELKAALAGSCEDDGLLETAVGSCHGSLTRAQSMISDPVYPKLYELAYDLLLKLSSSGGAAEYAFKLYDRRENLTEVIDFAETIMFSALRVSAPKDPRSREVAKLYPLSVALKESEVFSRARRRLELNGNVSAVIDELIFSLLEVRAKWK